MKAEIVHNAHRLIAEEDVDCLLFPEHSSIRFLSDALLAANNTTLQAVVCRRAFWPDQLAGYEVDVTGQMTLAAAKRVAIIEDETYTGSSIKDLISIVLQHSQGLERVIVFYVVDSMRRTERRLLGTVFRRGLGAGDAEHMIAFASRSFMRLALCAYWTSATCPLCRTLRILNRPEFRRLGFLEERYAARRGDELRKRQVDQDYQARRSLTPLMSPVLVSRPADRTEVKITTREGLELYCEEAYVEGDLHWMLERCHRSHAQSFEGEVLITVIELLSRDCSLLGRVQARKAFLDRVEALLVARAFRGPSLGRIIETFLGWPLYCLRDVWPALLKSVFSQSLEEFADCLPAMELLLEELEQRPAHTIRDALLQDFELRLSAFVEAAPPNDTEWRTRVLFAMCLQRGVDRLRPAYRHFGELLVDAHLLTAYFAPDRPSHQVLKSGLSALASSNADVPASRYMHVVQMLDHLRHSLRGLNRLDFGVTDWSNTEGYDRFDDLVSKLHQGFPHAGTISDGTAQIRDLAAAIGDLLYRDPTADAFRDRLQRYLGARRLSLTDFIQPLVAADIPQARIEFRSDAVRRAVSQVFIPIDEEARKGVLSDFVENMRKAASAWQVVQPHPSSLLANPAIFEVVLDCDMARSVVVLSVRNPRPPQTQNSGVGLAQIEMFLARFGHEYKLDDSSTEIAHEFRLRRIYP